MSEKIKKETLEISREKQRPEPGGREGLKFSMRAGKSSDCIIGKVRE